MICFSLSLLCGYRGRKRGLRFRLVVTHGLNEKNGTAPRIHTRDDGFIVPPAMNAEASALYIVCLSLYSVLSRAIVTFPLPFFPIENTARYRLFFYARAKKESRAGFRVFFNFPFEKVACADEKFSFQGLTAGEFFSPAF